MPKPSWGGAAAGAATGAAAGSAIPVIGTTLGAIGGGIAGLFGGNAGKKKEKTQQLQTKTKEQQELARLINEGLISGKGPFAELFGEFNPEEFEKGITQPALENFKENILPQILQKYSSGGQALGSGQRNAELKAGQKVQSDLATLMYQAQQQQRQNKLAGIQTGLGGGGVENVIRGGTPSAGNQFIQGLIPEAGKIIGNLMNKGNKNEPAASNTPATTVG